MLNCGSVMLDVEVIEEPAAAAVALDPVRARLLAELAEPASAATLAARVVREVAGLARRAERSGKRLPVLALDTEIRFRSAAERAAFTDELTAAVTGLVSRYHDGAAPGGRSHRLVVAAHPLPRTPDAEEDA